MAPRKLPHSEEAERAVLGSLLIEPNLHEQIETVLKAEDFYSERNADIYRAFLELRKNGGKPDLQTVRAKLEDEGKLDRIGGVAYLAGLDTELPDISNVLEYARIVKQRATRREMVEEFGALTKATLGGSAEPEEILARAQKTLERIENGSPGRVSPTMSASELLDLDLPELKPVVGGVIYVGVNLFGGKPKVGKSLLVAGVCVSVAAGELALGELETVAGDVLYLALEDGPRRLRKRLKSILGDKPPPERLTVANNWPRFDGGGLAQLRAWLQQHPEAKLICIDTLAKVRPRAYGRGDKYTIDYDTLAELQVLANRYGVAALVVTHTRKMPAEDWIDEISGSTGLTGAADAILLLRRSRNEAAAELLLTGRDVEEQSLALDFDAARGLWSILGKGEEYRLSTERREVLHYLKDLKGECAWPKEIAEALGKPDKVGSIKHLLSALREDGHILHCQRGYYVPIGDVVMFHRPGGEK